MKPFILLLAVCLLGCHPSNLQSQSTNPIPTQDSNFKEVNNVINDFFKKYKTDGPSKALDYIFGMNKYVNKSQLETLKSKLDSVHSVLGEFNGVAKITEKDVSTDLVLFSYLIKYEKQPIRFTLVFYKPKDNWVLYQFLYDDETVLELRDAAKIFVIK